MNDIQKHPTSPVGVWFSVTSSNLAQYRYDPKAKEFDVQFKGNPTCYRYSDVSLDEANGFVEAGKEGSEDTKGKYFARVIKTKEREYRKLTEEEAK